jgi:hypothetical protein
MNDAPSPETNDAPVPVLVVPVHAPHDNLIGKPARFANELRSHVFVDVGDGQSVSVPWTEDPDNNPAVANNPDFQQLWPERNSIEPYAPPPAWDEQTAPENR